MPKLDNWEEYYEIEENFKTDETRNKIHQREKAHNKKEWKKIEKQLDKKVKKEYVKNKKRKVRKNNNW